MSVAYSTVVSGVVPPLSLSSSSSFKHLLPISLPLSWITTNLLSVSLDVPVLDVSWTWNHTTCDLSCLASFT